MRSKDGKPTSDELLAQFDNLDVENTGDNEPAAKPSTPAAAPIEQDPLAELASLASQRPVSTDSRPPSRSPKPVPVGTPSTGQSSEEKSAVRRSEESGRSSHAGARTVPIRPTIPEENDATKTEEPGSGWWGGIFATASAAMKHAETAVKEIQNNEEAQRWAQQVKGNVGALKELGMYILLPPFS